MVLPGNIEGVIQRIIAPIANGQDRLAAAIEKQNELLEEQNRIFSKMAKDLAHRAYGPGYSTGAR